MSKHHVESKLNEFAESGKKNNQSISEWIKFDLMMKCLLFDQVVLSSVVEMTDIPRTLIWVSYTASEKQLPCNERVRTRMIDSIPVTEVFSKSNRRWILSINFDIPNILNSCFPQNVSNTKTWEQVVMVWDLDETEQNEICLHMELAILIKHKRMMCAFPIFNSHE